MLPPPAGELPARPSCTPREAALQPDVDAAQEEEGRGGAGLTSRREGSLCRWDCPQQGLSESPSTHPFCQHLCCHFSSLCMCPATETGAAGGKFLGLLLLCQGTIVQILQLLHLMSYFIKEKKAEPGYHKCGKATKLFV